MLSFREKKKKTEIDGMEIPAENRAKSLNFVFTFLDFTHLSELYKCLIQHNLLLAH